MSQSRTRQAIVLGHVDYGEADRIVRLLTAEEGRVAAMARGARRSKRRFAGTLDVGNRVGVQLRTGKGSLPVITEVHLEEGHPHVRGDLARITQMAYACELVAALARENHSEPKLFGLLQVALLVLDGATEAPGTVFRWGLEAKALSFAGLTPGLRRCMVCDLPFGTEALRYSPSLGGVVHAHCGSGAVVDSRWCAQVESARMTPLADRVDEEPVAGPAWALHDHLVWHVGHPLKSRTLLASIGELS